MTVLGSGLRWVLPAAIAGALALIPASASGDSEVISDGGFEDSTCQEVPGFPPHLDCTNPSWEGVGIQQSMCAFPYCLGDRAANGVGYLILGGSYMDNYNWMSASVAQTIDLPQGGPKKLTFALKGLYDSPVSAGSVNVKIDDDFVFGAGSPDVLDEYVTESIDLGDLAGEHEVRFGVECVSFQTPFPESCDGFTVDDVSLRIPRIALEFTSGPPETTERRRVRFAFTADDPGASFTCNLDRAGAEPCTSPFRTRAGVGSHLLRVKAQAHAREVSRSIPYRWAVTRAR